MLERTLQLVQEIFPPSELGVSDQVWTENRMRFCDALSQVSDELLKTVKLVAPRRIFSESTDEFVVSAAPSIIVSEFRLRPRSGYYKKLGRPVPSPENPRGPHATGIEINLSLCRGYPIRGRVCTPFLSMELVVWGQHERAGFRELLLDHKRSIEKLLDKPGLEFRTACVFENLERSRTSNAFKKLTLYFQNENDDEHNFSIERPFRGDATSAELTSTLLLFMAIYDAALGYCRTKKNRDRIFDYVPVVQKLELLRFRPISTHQDAT